MSNRMTHDDQLAHVPLFGHLSRKERREVDQLMTQVDLEPGQVLAHQGATGHEFFLIVGGTAKVERDGVHVADVGPGDFQGEISLLDGGPRTATVTATSPMVIMVATQIEFFALLDRVPALARQMLPALAHRVRAANDAALTY